MARNNVELHVLCNFPMVLFADFIVKHIILVTSFIIYLREEKMDAAYMRVICKHCLRRLLVCLD